MNRCCNCCCRDSEGCVKWAEIARNTLYLLPEKLHKDFGLWVAQDPLRTARYERDSLERRQLVLEYYHGFADKVLEGVRLA